MKNLKAMALKWNCWGQASSMSTSTAFSVLCVLQLLQDTMGNTFKKQLGSGSKFGIIMGSFIEI